MPHLKPVGHQSTNWIVPGASKREDFLEKFARFFSKEKTQRMHQKRKGEYIHTPKVDEWIHKMMGLGKCVSFQTSPSC